MKRFMNAGRGAVESGNMYAALTLALVVPDICSQLETPKEKVGDRYRRWFRRWGEPRFTAHIGPERMRTVFLSAQDCYLLRCSLLHAGSAELEAANATVRKFIFCAPTVGAHMNLININSTQYLQLRADQFCNDLFDAAEEWDHSVQTNADIQNRKSKLLSLSSAGDNIDGLIRFS
jgi:hypothetical protein